MNRSKYSFKRFHDLSENTLNCDLHIHTDWTDGKSSIGEILVQASLVNLNYIAFTEHVRLTTDWFADFAAQVRRQALEQPSPSVLVGCEAKALNNQGVIDASAETLELCDIVLGSVHRFPDGVGGLLEFSAVDPVAFADIEFKLALGMLQNAPIDVLAHPGGMHSRRFKTDLPVQFIRELMKCSLDRRIAIEINSSYLQDFEGFLNLCDEINPYVSIGSDVHRLETVGHCRDKLLLRQGRTR